MSLRYSWLIACCCLPACSRETVPSGGAQPVPTWRPSGGETPRSGGETTDFGGNDPPACTWEESAIGRERAIELGFDPDADLAAIVGTREAAFQWSDARCLEPGRCEPTRLTLSARFESMQLISRHVVENVIVPEGECRDELQYRLQVELAAADGSIRGSFPADVLSRTYKQVDSESWGASAWPALDDITGTRELLIDEGRPHWSRLDVSLSLGANTRGELTPWVFYTDGREPREHQAGPAGVVRSRAEPQVLEWSPPRKADRVSLDDYQGSREPPTFRVEVYPHPEAEGASLVLSVNGEVSTYHDVPLDHVLDLGRLQIGDVIAADLTSPEGLAGVGIRMGDCTYGGTSCRTPGCTVHVETTVEPVRCPAPGLMD